MRPLHARQYREGQRIGVPNIGCGLWHGSAGCRTWLITRPSALRSTVHAEYVRIPRPLSLGSVHCLPDGLSFSDAADRAAFCVVNCNRASRIEMGDTVDDSAGPMGLMHAMLARLAARVLVVDVKPSRLSQATEVGATSTLNSAAEVVRDRVMAETAGRGADVVITACSVAAVQEQAIGLLAPFGRVCFFGGLPKDGSLVRLDTNIVHYKQLLLTGVTGGSPRDFRTAMNLIVSGRVNIGKVVRTVSPPPTWPGVRRSSESRVYEDRCAGEEATTP